MKSFSENNRKVLEIIKSLMGYTILKKINYFLDKLLKVTSQNFVLKRDKTLFRIEEKKQILTDQHS